MFTCHHQYYALYLLLMVCHIPSLSNMEMVTLSGSKVAFHPGRSRGTEPRSTTVSVASTVGMMPFRIKSSAFIISPFLVPLVKVTVNPPTKAT